MSAATRPRLRDHVCVGIRVISTDEQRIWKVAQVWRADRQVLLVGRDGERRRIAWADLSRRYAMVQPFAGGSRSWV